MKFLVIGDIHGESNSLSRVLLAAVPYNPDAMILVGDIGSPILGSRVEHTSLRENLYEKSLQSIFSILELFDLPTFFVPGNRDLVHIKYTNANINNVDIMGEGAPGFMAHMNIIGIGGAGLTTGQWPYEWDDPGAYAGILQRINCISGLEHTIMVMHDPPFHTRLDRNRTSVHSGNEALRRLIEEKQPSLVVCGHIHESPGVDIVGVRTLAINAGGILKEDADRLYITKQHIDIRISQEEQFFIVSLEEQGIQIEHFFFSNNQLFVRNYVFDEDKLFLSQNGILVQVECTYSKAYPSKGRLEPPGNNEVDGEGARTKDGANNDSW